VAGLGELLELMHGARHRFRTVRAEVLERHHTERHMRAFERRTAERPGTSLVGFAAGPAAAPLPEWSEHVTRLWWDRPDRLRLERMDMVQVRVGERWWSVSETFGAAAGDVRSDVQMGIEHPPFPALFDPAVLLPDLDLEVTGEARLLGRAVLEVRGLPRGEREDWSEPRVPGGADAHLLTVDAALGVVLRLVSLIDGAPFAVTEVRAVAFDEALPDDTWVVEPPPGESFGPLTLPRHEHVTLDEAQRRAPFTVLVPRRVPVDAEIEITFGPAVDRPPTPAFVSLGYRAPGRGLDVRISQASAATDHALDLREGAERIEDGDRVVWIRDMGGQLQAMAERDGTRAMLLSQSAPRDMVIDMALSLEPAPGDPPALTG
jgi:hypothetical protein